MSEMTDEEISKHLSKLEVIAKAIYQSMIAESSKDGKTFDHQDILYMLGIMCAVAITSTLQSCTEKEMKGNRKILNSWIDMFCGQITEFKELMGEMPNVRKQ